MRSLPDDRASLSRSPTRVFSLVLLLVFTVEGAIMLLLPDDYRDGVSGALVDATALTLLLAPAIWLLTVRPLRHLFEARGRLLQRLFESQEEERARVARDLHDGIGQHLTALLVGLRTVERCEDLETARTRVRELRTFGARAHEEVRALARGLRPVALQELGLVHALEQLCADFGRTQEIAIAFECEAPLRDERIEPGVEAALYRIAQEALANVAHHAGARRVAVRLARAPDGVALRIRDDGRGLDAVAPGRREGFGLDSMRERAELLGGELVVASERDAGTTVEVRLPVPERQ
jgi:two-component system sensor histidine kinase UhpB